MDVCSYFNIREGGGEGASSAEGSHVAGKIGYSPGPPSYRWWLGPILAEE